MIGNRSSDNDNKIHETEAFLPELKTKSFLYKGEQPALLASCYVAVLAPSGTSEAEFLSALLFAQSLIYVDLLACLPVSLPACLPTIFISTCL